LSFDVIASNLVESRMSVAAQLSSPLACPVCRGRVDVRSKHVIVAGTTVRVYCSAECLRARDPKPEPPPEVIVAETPPRRAWWWLAGGIVVGTTCLAAVAYTREQDEQRHVAAPPAKSFWPLPDLPAASPPVSEAVDPQRAADELLLAELARDAWLHPLAGPTRRMPVNHNGAFGAERPGERPPECVSGHCGVDLGNVWGEPVHAAHGGVVDFVHRGPNEERGGIFVKVSHREGTLFTWYFHLAAVPKWIRAGTKVQAGQVIGLLGDTGVFNSGPHLHFAISVKPTKAARERYLDPEPLIAIWPLWIPNENRLSTAPEPGLPVRASSKRRSKSKKPSEPMNDNVNDNAGSALPVVETPLEERSE
jgi:murein DD-endopeptidase MepM/ murein hydrolase activator NlpD